VHFRTDQASVGQETITGGTGFFLVFDVFRELGIFYLTRDDTTIFQNVLPFGVGGAAAAAVVAAAVAQRKILLIAGFFILVICCCRCSEIRLLFPLFPPFLSLLQRRWAAAAL